LADVTPLRFQSNTPRRDLAFAVFSKLQGARGVVKSLGGLACGPVVLIHTQKFLNSIRKAHLCELRHLRPSSRLQDNPARQFLATCCLQYPRSLRRSRFFCKRLRCLLPCKRPRRGKEGHKRVARRIGGWPKAVPAR